LLATAAVALALLVDVYTPGASVAPQSSPYALAPLSVSDPIEGRAAYIDSAPGQSTDRHVAKAHASTR
jgi:hypothetical protein